ncbi:MAG: alpha/beta hydrolase [Actinomycetota bacterium]
MADGAVLYFHGSSSERDTGPSTDIDLAGINLIRHVRPGYDNSPPRPQANLQDVAAAAIEEATPVAKIVLMGWSGGGPYALAGGSLGHPAVRGVALLGSWAPMDPPHRGLPVGVQLFIRLARLAPRPVLRSSLAAVGLRNPGHVDDIQRVAKPWGFTVEDVGARVPVAAWHSEQDPEVPIGPWEHTTGIDLHHRPGADHNPTGDTWQAALSWARALIQ